MKRNGSRGWCRVIITVYNLNAPVQHLASVLHHVRLSLDTFSSFSHPACCSFALRSMTGANPHTDSQRLWLMSKQEVFPRTNAQRWQVSHNLSLCPSLFCDWMHIHKQATCLSIISCLYTESLTVKKQKFGKGRDTHGWHRSNVSNAHPDNLASLSQFCTHCKVSSNLHINSLAGKNRSQVWYLLKWDKLTLSVIAITHVHTCVCLNRHSTGTTRCLWISPCDFSLGVRDVTLAILCQCYLGATTCLSLALT